jgi:hypothetical protein
MTDYEAFQADQEALQKASLDALKASLARPLTADEAMALAYSAGVANDFYKEMKQ